MNQKETTCKDCPLNKPLKGCLEDDNGRTFCPICSNCPYSDEECSPEFCSDPAFQEQH